MLTVTHRIKQMRDRGATPLETLFALGLMSLLGLMVIQLARSARFYNDTTATVRNVQDARQTMNGAVRALQTARPLGVCLDNPDADIPIDRCRRVGEHPFQVREARSGDETTGARLCYWGLIDPAVSAYTPPDLICVTELVAQEQLVLQVWDADPDATYTSPADLDARTSDPDGPPDSNRLIGRVDPAETAIEFYNRDGEVLDDVFLDSDEGRRAVAYVEIKAVVIGGGDGRLNDGEARAELTFSVGLRGSRIARDQSGGMVG